jgi:hypothetical protein
MAQLVIFPDVEALLVEILNDGFDDLDEQIKASTRVPNPRPAEFVKVLVSGGIDETMVTDSVLVTIEGWAKTEPRARQICELARAILRSQDGEIRGVRGFGYPQNLPDPVSDQVRYTSTGDVRVWGAASS